MRIAEYKLRSSDTIYKYAHLENPYIEPMLNYSNFKAKFLMRSVRNSSYRCQIFESMCLVIFYRYFPRIQKPQLILNELIGVRSLFNEWLYLFNIPNYQVIQS